MEGYILIDKPIGWTSFDVVGYIRKNISIATDTPRKKIKVGHGGTLDPFASGLLIVFAGKSYTSRFNEFLKLDKTYSVSMVLGSHSTTGDPEGEIIKSLAQLVVPSREVLVAKLEGFKGESQQVPPAYSAIKVDGVRAYKLARENKSFQLTPRRIIINHIELLDYDYPVVDFVVNVSSGTYIRALVEDIGKALNTMAYTNNLRRIEVGSYSISNAHTIDKINEHTINQLLIK